MKITFIKDHKVKQGDGNGPHYKTGDTHDLERSYAEKYKRLNLAVDFVEPVQPETPRAKEPDPVVVPPVEQAAESEVPAQPDVFNRDAETHSGGSTRGKRR